MLNYQRVRATRNMFHNLRESTCCNYIYICSRTNAKLGLGVLACYWAYRIKRDFNFRRDRRACIEDSQVQVDEIVEALCGAPIFASLEKWPSTRLMCDDPNCFVLHFGVTLVSPVCFSLKGGMQTALSSQALEVLIRKKRLQKAITARRPRYLQGGKMCFGFFQNEGGDPQTRKSSFEWGIKIESWSLGYPNKSTWFTALTSPFPILWFTYIAHPSMELDHTIAGCIQWMAALYRPRILIYHPPEMARMHIKLGPMLQVTAGNSPQFIVTCVHVGAGTAGGLLINMCT